MKRLIYLWIFVMCAISVNAVIQVNPGVSLSNQYFVINNTENAILSNLSLTNTEVILNNVTLTTDTDLDLRLNAKNLSAYNFTIQNSNSAFIDWNIDTDNIYSLYRYKNEVVYDDTTGQFTLTWLSSGDEFQVMLSNASLNVSATDAILGTSLSNFTVTISTTEPFSYSHQETANGQYLNVSAISGFDYNVTVTKKGYQSNTTQINISNAEAWLPVKLSNTSTMKFNFFDEKTLLPIVNVSYVLTGSNEGEAQSGTLNGTSSILINALDDDDYTLSYYRSDYPQRQFYFNIPRTDLLATNVSLYLLDNVSSSDFVVSVTDNNNQVLPYDVLVTILRKYNINNQTRYLSVAMTQPTAIYQGQAAFNAEPNTVPYLFRVTRKDTGAVLFQGASSSTQGYYSAYLISSLVYLRISPSATPFNSVLNLRNLQYSLTNSTDTFYLSWEDTENAITQMCLNVKVNDTGGTISQCSSELSGILSYKTAYANNTFYIARAVATEKTTGRNVNIDIRMIDNRENKDSYLIFGALGLFLTLLALVLLWVTYAENLAACIVGSGLILTLFGTSFLGLIYIVPIIQGTIIIGLLAVLYVVNKT